MTSQISSPLPDYAASNILLTGGAGFIGSSVAHHLSSRYPNYRIVVLDKLDLCASEKNLIELKSNPNVIFIKGDICSSDLVVHLLSAYRIDTVLHFAAQTHVDDSFGNSIHFTESNIVGTHVLLESVKSLAGQIKRFIHVSTDEVYGGGESESADSKNSLENQIRSTENSPLNPTNPYAATKVGAEFLVKSYQSSFKLPCIITRGNNVYGPRQFPEKLIPKFINLLSRNQPCPLHGTGRNRRSYLFIDDVAAAFDLILHRGEIGKIYNIGSNEEYENKEVLDKLIKIFRSQYPSLLNSSSSDDHYCEYVRDRYFNDFRYHIDSSSLIALGWRVAHTFEIGLQKTVKWYLDRPNYWKHLEIALKPHPFDSIGGDDMQQNASDQFPVRVIDQNNNNNNSSSISSPVSALISPSKSSTISDTSNDSSSVAAIISDDSAVSSVVSSTDSNSASATAAAVRPPLKWLIYGHLGTVGIFLVKSLRFSFPTDVITSNSIKSDDEIIIANELSLIKPDRVILLDENILDDNIEINLLNQLYIPLLLSTQCQLRSIHFTHIGYNNYNNSLFISHINSSIIKSFTDRLFHLSMFSKGILNVRIRSPMTTEEENIKLLTIQSLSSNSTNELLLDSNENNEINSIKLMLEQIIKKESGMMNLTNL